MTYLLSDRIQSGTDIMQRIVGGQRSALTELANEVATLEQRAERMGGALLLMLASPEERLEYCKEQGLLPSEITATESVDEYWRKQIAKEALAAEKPPPFDC